MLEPPEDWPKSKQTKYRLLKPAFKEGRGYEVILRIQWALAKQAHMSNKALTDFNGLLKEIFREEALQTAAQTTRPSLYNLTTEKIPKGVHLN